MKFIVIGNGFLLDTAIKAIQEKSGEVIAIFTSEETKFQKYSALPVYTSPLINDEKQSVYTLLDAHTWLVSAESTVIIKPHILALFAGRAINFHPGLLPAYAGLYTYQWAVRNGEKRFGSTIHFMTEKVDAGDILTEEQFDITDTDTGLSVYQKCMRAGGRALTQALEYILSDNYDSQRIKQQGMRKNYKAKEVGDGIIRWEWNAETIVNFIRAGNFEPLQSPAYVAKWNADIRILRATVSDVVEKDIAAGSIITLNEQGPLVMAGDGHAVQIALAKDGENRPLTQQDWQAVVV